MVGGNPGVSEDASLNGGRQRLGWFVRPDLLPVAMDNPGSGDPSIRG